MGCSFVMFSSIKLKQIQTVFSNNHKAKNEQLAAKAKTWPYSTQTVTIERTETCNPLLRLTRLHFSFHGIIPEYNTHCFGYPETKKEEDKYARTLASSPLYSLVRLPQTAAGRVCQPYLTEISVSSVIGMA